MAIPGPQALTICPLKRWLLPKTRLKTSGNRSRQTLESLDVCADYRQDSPHHDHTHHSVTTRNRFNCARQWQDLKAEASFGFPFLCAVVLTTKRALTLGRFRVKSWRAPEIDFIDRCDRRNHTGDLYFVYGNSGPTGFDNLPSEALAPAENALKNLRKSLTADA